MKTPKTKKSLYTLRKNLLKQSKKLQRIMKTKQFGRRYLVFAAILLGVSTIFWAIIGSLIQQGNADQLVNPLLTRDIDTFRGAIFPDQHTFLLKLPFFGLIQLLGGGSIAFSAITVLLCVLTVGGLAYVLYRIDKRPLVLGTILLALAVCLILTPAEPYAGALLPTNLAMVTTRNIEYIVFIISLIFLINAKRYRSWSFVLASAIMIVLIASDKLFVSLSIGGAVLALVTYLIVRQKQLIHLAIKWLVVSVISYIGATGLLLGLNAVGLLHTSSPIGAGPYGIVHSVKDFAIGLFYGVAGVFTNFGANPLVDVRVITDIPHHLLGLIHPTYLVYLVTIAITVGVIVVMVRLFKTSLIKIVKIAKKPIKQLPDYTQLSLLLIFTSVAACGVFVFSNHYYPVDSRYLTIIFFAGFIALACFLKDKKISSRLLVIGGVVLTVCVLVGVPIVLSGLQSHTTAAADTDERNALIAGNIKIHPVDTLIGDYWRVLPIQSIFSGKLRVMPMEACTAARSILTSKTWQPNLSGHSFAYLLTLESSTTGYPACSLTDIIATYGKPNQSAVIKGTATNPKEILLFYDQGTHLTTTKSQSLSLKTDTVTPVLLKDVPNLLCDKPVIMQFVAHEDDDILFMNPDLVHDIEAKKCIRTIYFTAGDAGGSDLYWIGRQKGSEAAYDSMLGKPNQVWTERVVQLPGGQIATIANPKANHSISLIFLHLPDGNPNGTGFSKYGNQSQNKLYFGKINSINTVSADSSYTSAQLTGALVSLIEAYKPSQLRSHSGYEGTHYLDHSDHTNVARYTARAYEAYKKTHSKDSLSLTYYLGYPVHSLAPNVVGADYEKKVASFIAFSRFDGATCHTINECNTRSVYGLYLKRQYTYPY